MKNKLSPAMIITAGILWGTLGIFVRRINSCGVSSMSIVFLRTFITAAAVFIGTAIFDRRQLKIALKDIWIFVCLGLFSLTMFNFCYFSAVSMMSLSVAAILLYTSPLFVMLISAAVFKEKITKRKLAAIAASLIGLPLVTGIGSADSVTPLGVLFGIGSAIGYALYSIFTRAALNKGYSALTITGWGFAFAAFFSAFAADLGAVGNMFVTAPSMILYVIFFAVTASILPYILYSQGLKGMENGKAAVIASIEPVAATLFGIALYGEYPSPMAVAGIILVLAALVLSIDMPKNIQEK